MSPAAPKPENAIAVRVQILYLLNLLLLPGIAFLLIIQQYKANKHSQLELTRSHVSQALVASVVLGVLVVVFISLMLLFGSADDPYTWMWIILYFTCIHAVFILLGVFGLVKAMASQTVTYPLLHGPSRRLEGYEVIS